MRSISRIQVVFGIVMLALASPALAQRDLGDLDFASTPNPVGSGGRAVAWGGAFIAVADDATAASWNPAGLIQLSNPEASVVFSYSYRTDTQEFEHWDVDQGAQVASHAELNYASAVYPFHIKDVNFVTSINYQRLYEFDRKMKFVMSGNLEEGDYFEQEVKFEQIGALSTVSPALAVQITPAFSLGVTLNFWGHDQNADGWAEQLQSEGWREVLHEGPDAISYHWAEERSYYKVQGTSWTTNFNPVFGLLWTPGNFTIGLVYKHWFDLGIDYDWEYERAAFSPTNPNLIVDPETSKEEQYLKIRWPQSYGVGLGYRYSDALSFAIDAYITEWSTFKLTDEEGNEFSLISGRADDSDVYAPNTMQLHAGVEYLWIRPQTVIAFRGGFLYDPEPTEIDDDDKHDYQVFELNYGNDKRYHLDFSPRAFYGFALGTGVGYKNIVVDAAIQYRWATHVEGEEIRGEQATSDIQDWFFIVSVIYYL